MSTITLPYDINNGDALDADKVMANENAIVAEYNAEIGAKAGDPVTTAEVQTLSNKTADDMDGTLLKPTIKGSVQNIITDTDAATVTFDLVESNTHVLTLVDDRILAIANGIVGQYFSLELIQGGTTSRTPTWFSTIKWTGGTIPTLTKTGIVTIATLNTGGTGYTVNDILTVTGGKNNCTFKVTTVNSGVITGWTLVTAGDSYAVANGLSMTGGTGTGAKINITGITDNTGKKDTFMFRITGAGTYDGYIVGMNI